MIYINYLSKIISISIKSKFNILLLSTNLIFVINSFSQSSFEFLTINDNAKIKALGGNNVSLTKNQNYYLSNPSFLFYSTNQNISINHMNYIADINSSSILYSDSLKHIGKFGIGIKYFSHGKFDGYDVLGNSTGSFNPKEFAITITKSIKFSNFIFGTNFKYVNSKIYNKSDNAFLIDIGVIFYPTTKKNLTIGMTISNFGFIFSKNNTYIPFFVQIGTTFKPEYMPIRFSFTINKSSEKNHLLNIYSNSFNKLLSLMNIGTEILISKNINFQLGYNYKLNKELSLTNNRNNGGISYGIEILLKRFNINYARVVMNTINTSNVISLNFNLKRI